MNTPARKPLFETVLNGVEEITKDVFVISFPRKDEFRPGQMIAIALKPDDQPRLYSIASGYTDKNYRVLFNILHEGYLTPRLSKVKVGESLFISKPFGSFYGTEEADYWIAAGTGIAPFISMLESGIANNKILVHGGRAAESFYYADVFAEKLKEKYIRCSSLIKDDEFYHGRITAYLKQTQDISQERNYYICGSSEFVVDVRDILIKRGIHYHQIIAEIYF